MTTTAGCALVGRPGPDVVLHPLPRLPELGSVALPAGFVGHVQPTLPYASQNTVHVDSAFFEFGGYDARDATAAAPRSRSRATTRSSPPRRRTSASSAPSWANSAWFGTQWDTGWRPPSPTEPGLWTLVFLPEPQRDAVAELRFVPTRGLAVGLWADADVYALPEAVAVTDWAVSSIG